MPVDQDGNRVEGREVASTVSMSIETVDPGGLPGFQDALEASWEALLTLGGLLVLLVGAILPFIWVIPVAWLVYRWMERRREEDATPETTSDTPLGDAAAEPEVETESAE